MARADKHVSCPVLVGTLLGSDQAKSFSFVRMSNFHAIINKKSFRVLVVT